MLAQYYRFFKYSFAINLVSQASLYAALALLYQKKKRVRIKVCALSTLPVVKRKCFRSLAPRRQVA